MILFRVQLGVKRKRKYFKVNKIARARWAAAICNFFIYTKLLEKSCSLLFKIYL